MTVYKQDGCEYSELIADLMVTLDEMDEYTVKFWVNNKEIPYTFRTEDKIVFLQEGIKARKHLLDSKHNIVYIWYDTIDSIVVMDFEN